MSKSKELLSKINILSKEADNKRVLESAEPHVGIFWINPVTHKTFAHDMYTKSEQAISGVHTEVAVLGPATHSHHWSILQKFGSPEVYSGKYDETPRGRVLFDKTDNRYKVHLPGSHINNTVTRNDILDTFNLPSNNTDFEHFTAYDKD
jgi:hypothetical protein